MRGIAVTGVALALLFGAARANGAEELLPGTMGTPVSDFAAQVGALNRVNPKGVLYEYSGEVAGAEFLRVALTIVAPAAFDDVSVVITDGLGDEFDRWDLKGFSGVKDVWSKLIAGDRYIVSVTGKPQASGASVSIRHVVRDGGVVEPLSVVGRDDRERVARLQPSRLRDASRAVVKVAYFDHGSLAVCSGFLISPTQVLTNQHCVADADTCESALALFDYESRGMVPASKQRRCASVQNADYDLDYAVLKLDRAADAAIHPLRLASSPATPNQAATVIQHPGGDVKQLSRKQCAVVNAPVKGRKSASDFTHSCDTLGGSSGSPVLDSQLKVIGLHHFGIGGDEPQYNRAVRIELIAEKMRHERIIP